MTALMGAGDGAQISPVVVKEVAFPVGVKVGANRTLVGLVLDLRLFEGRRLKINL